MFRYVRILFCMSTLCLVGRAQPAPSETKKAIIEGRIFNQVTMKPLSRVEVRLLRPDKNGVADLRGAAAYSALSDTEGKFRFERVEPGQYKINYRKAGYVAGRGGAAAMGGIKLVTVKADEVQTGLRYYLLVQGIVAGRVLDDEGEPVQGVRVALIQGRYEGGMQRMFPYGQMSTNEKGEYRITEVVPGQYYIQANLFRGFSPADGSWGPAAPPKAGEARMGYVSTWFPNASEPEQAIRVTVPPGQELPGQDISLRREKVVKLICKLVWPGGVPVAGARVTYVPRGTAVYFGGSSVPTDEKGIFTIDEMRPGDYALMVRSSKGAAGGTQQRGLQSLIRLHVGDREVEEITLEWQPEMRGSGAFVVEGSGGRSLDLAGCTLTLMPIEFSLPVGSVGWAKSDGRFEIDPLLPIRFRPDASCPGGNPYVKSILVGDEDVLGKETDGSMVAATAVKVIVRTAAANVSGALDVSQEKKGQLDKPLVALLATDERLRSAGFIDEPEVDQDFHFHSGNLRPGEYLVLAFEEGDVLSLMDPEFYRLIESKGVKVTVGANESKNVDLKILDWPPEFADRLR